MRKPVDIKIGSIRRSVVVTIGHAVAIESATGMGVIMLMSKLQRMEATIAECAAIVSAATGGDYPVSVVLDNVADSSIIELQVTAAEILSRLFSPVDTAKPAKKGGKQADPLAVSP